MDTMLLTHAELALIILHPCLGPFAEALMNPEVDVRCCSFYFGKLIFFFSILLQAPMLVHFAYLSLLSRMLLQCRDATLQFMTSGGDAALEKMIITWTDKLVSIGQPVVELVPTATYVVANFKETQVGKMSVGQKAEIEIDAFPGRKLEGEVASLSGGTGASFSLLPADNATGNFVKVVQRVPVRIAWKNLPGDVPLRAGLSADVTVEVGK